MQPTSRGVYYITNDKNVTYRTNVVNKHLKCADRNILLAFTTSCVSIFDISNDILYTSFTSTNADFRLTQILHVPLCFIGQKFSHEQIQHGLLFTKRIA